MIDAGKIRLMTDLAIYEKEHGDRVFKVNDFYKSDYIVSNLIAAFVRYTICAALLLLCALLFQTELFFGRINEEGITEVLIRIGICYGAGLLVYFWIAYTVCERRYQRAKRGVLLYASKLKRLQRKYGSTGKTVRRSREQ